MTDVDPRAISESRWATAGPDFLRSEAAGGAALLVATIIALVWANIPGDNGYVDFWHTSVTLGWGDFSITHDLQHWITDGFMTLFFFVVGLEVKRELVEGELADPKKAALPFIGAIGGVLVPILVFKLIVGGGEGSDGWAIPMATDIAFAVAILAVLGRRIPAGVRVLLLSIAIVDDVLAILVIAIFYSSGVSLVWLAAFVFSLLIVLAMRKIGVVKVWPYVIVGLIAWVELFESGIHATLVGVALGLLTPAGIVGGRHLLSDLEHAIHPWTGFLVIPVFALANAGIVFSAPLINDALASALFWGILVGLVLGKTLGISLFTLLSVRFGIGTLPEGVKPNHVIGVAMLGGIGFTVSIFITQLSFGGSDMTEIAKMAILAGSVVAAIIGSIMLLLVGKDPGQLSVAEDREPSGQDS